MQELLGIMTHDKIIQNQIIQKLAILVYMCSQRELAGKSQAISSLACSCKLQAGRTKNDQVEKLLSGDMSCNVDVMVHHLPKQKTLASCRMLLEEQTTVQMNYEHSRLKL